MKVPNRDYDYFFESASRPLLPEIDRFDVATAWWLAELSFLGYVKELDFKEEKLSEAGFEGARFVTREDIHAMVVHRPDALIVVFRGTDISSLKNLLTDARFKPTEFEEHGLVHRGFLDALDAVWPDLESRIAQLADGRSVYFTGHSPGRGPWRPWPPLGIRVRVACTASAHPGSEIATFTRTSKARAAIAASTSMTSSPSSHRPCSFTTSARSNT